MQGILYEEPSIWLFLLVTVIMGGWAAWMTGRAIAITWRPFWNLLLYLLILGAARAVHPLRPVRGTLLSVHYLCDRRHRAPDHRQRSVTSITGPG